ncbi:MAG: NAD-dependent protein deacylase, partial [Rhodobacteraceae bacterium]|nr:NAD-dependent protein deacylase [Paracoccaceae bacterium]
MPSIVVLSGAGLSAESGLGTFRDASGLWTEYNLRDVATPDGFARNPKLVHDFYNARRANAFGAQPNAAHRALARLESELGEELYCVTQNIDPLLERAGLKRVVHMHGEIARALCAACGHRWDAPEATSPDDPCPACGAQATRPDVVWFG